MDMHFLSADLTNAYRNLTNLVLALVPRAAAHVPALLLGAHFDTTLDTPGPFPPRLNTSRSVPRALDVPALLLGAHFDATLDTPGLIYTLHV